MQNRISIDDVAAALECKDDSVFLHRRHAAEEVRLLDERAERVV